MESFRANIIRQIDHIKRGVVFSLYSFTFPIEKTANVCVLLSELYKKGIIKRVGKGNYYKPLMSSVGLGELPLYEDQKIEFVLQHYKGYITGIYAYNKLHLTNQVSNCVTVACARPIRPFQLNGTSFKFVKAYVNPTKGNLHLLPLLDAIKDAGKIPGNTLSESLRKIADILQRFDAENIEKLVLLSNNYPARTKYRLVILMLELGYLECAQTIKKRINPTTKFEVIKIA